MNATIDEMLTDVWAHRYTANPKLLELVEDEDFSVDTVAEELAALELAAGASNDEWETIE